MSLINSKTVNASAAHRYMQRVSNRFDSAVLKIAGRIHTIYAMPHAPIRTIGDKLAALIDTDDVLAAAILGGDLHISFEREISLEIANMFDGRERSEITPTLNAIAAVIGRKIAAEVYALLSLAEKLALVAGDIEDAKAFCQRRIKSKRDYRDQTCAPSGLTIIPVPKAQKTKPGQAWRRNHGGKPRKERAA